MKLLLRFKASDGATFPDWEEMTLGTVGRFATCGHVKAAHMLRQGDVPLFSIGTLGGTPEVYISHQLYAELRSKHPFPPLGAILLSVTGTIGRAVEYQGGCAYFQQSNIVWMEHDANVLDPFLRHYYSSVKWPHPDGSVVKFMSRKAMRAISFARPSILEQQKIAEFFDAIDAVIAKCESELSAWQEYKRGLCLQLFRQKVRFKSAVGSAFPAWQTLPLGSLVSIHARAQGLNCRDYEFLPQSDHLLITGTDLKDGRVDFKTCRYIRADSYERELHAQVQNGDVLMTRCGTLGKIAFVEKLERPATLNFGIFVLRAVISKILPLYLFYYLSAPMLMQFFDEHAAGTVIKNINKSVLVNFPVGLPALPEQYKIARALTAIDAIIAAVTAELKAWQALKRGLLQVMFVHNPSKRRATR